MNISKKCCFTLLNQNIYYLPLEVFVTKISEGQNLYF